MRHRISLVLMLAGLLVATGCGADDPTGPTLPPPPGQPGSLYDGLWTSDFTQADYPVRGMRFEIQQGALVHVYVDSFWDIAQCNPSFANTRFDPPAPAPIVNGMVSVTGLSAGPLTIDRLSVAFASSTDSSGALTISIDQGGTCVADDMGRPFAAERS